MHFATVVVEFAPCGRNKGNRPADLVDGPTGGLRSAKFGPVRSGLAQFGQVWLGLSVLRIVVPTLVCKVT